MLIDETLITVLFRLINFGLVILLISYIVKTYISPYVVSVMTQKQAHENRLISDKLDLDREYTLLEGALRKNNDYYRRLMKNVDQWKKIVALQKSIVNQEAALLQQRYIQLQQEKESALHKRYMQKALAKRVINDLEKDIGVYFSSGEKNVLDYTDHVINFMTERKQ